MYLDGPIGLVHIIPFHIFHLFPIQPFILSLSRNFRLCINGYKSLVLFDVWLKLKTLIFFIVGGNSCRYFNHARVMT